ncbi:DUF6262 family protein [Synechocystis sp. PCC 7509]|uniref:DUF6262 family protein n=1 Tax=Synechocystis sp. PCC 7509 TaxID=927677 RepID=UPI0002AD091F|nr:DUF6262 family protein [Synechocystis sp. PCC 7509]
MSRGDTRESRIDILKQTQEARKQDSLDRVYKAIERLRKLNAKINFQTIAKEANVSVSYLYKYPELKRHIAELRSKQNSMPVTPVAQPNSSATGKIIARLKERIRQLEQENSELKRKNEALAGQVYRVHYLQEQVERQQQTIVDLQTRIKERVGESSAVKVTPIAQAKSRQVSDVVQDELKSLRIRSTESLNRVIREHDEETVLFAIEAFRQYKKTHEIQSLAGCLRRAIEEGWVPNEAAEPSTFEHNEFDQFYADAVAKGFLLDVPKNHLSVQGGEFVVKIDRASVYGSWTPMPWHQAKAEYEEEYTDC